MTAEDSQPVTVSVAKDFRSRAIDMAFQSGPTVIVLGVCLYWVATQIPVHLSTIQAGYKEVIKENHDQTKSVLIEIESRHATSIKDLAETFTREQERTERLFLNRGMNPKNIAGAK